jgi:protoporphyrin/coproporphyrin ferrochelatase
MTPATHPVIAPAKIGILLINLGTPDAPTPAAVKRYLKEFLSDRRVVELPSLLWQPILRGVILHVRPRKSAHAYQQVWTDAGSPLAAITARQAQALADRLHSGQIIVSHAMRYGNPAIAKQIRLLKEQGCERILLAPLYPQYCAATTATALDAVYASLAKLRWQPALRTLPPYYADPVYIDALASSINAQLQQLDFQPDALIATFHGMPQRTLHLGDPYHCHCQKTARLLGEALGRKLIISFQSRFGPAKWLEPATDTVLEALPAKGVKRVALIAPGFAADCLDWQSGAVKVLSRRAAPILPILAALTIAILAWRCLKNFCCANLPVGYPRLRVKIVN